MKQKYISYYLLLEYRIQPSGYVIAYSGVGEGVVYKNKFKMEQRFGIENIDFDKLVNILESSKNDYICFYAHNINKRLLNTLIKLFNYIEKNNIKVILPKKHE